jgi:hypothetical protein
MDAAAVLSLLDHISESHQRMIALADVLDWDGLDGEWRRIHPKIVELQRIPLDQLTGKERTQAAKQIAGLLEFEKRISARVGPWMEQVQPLLEVFRKFPLKSEDAR